MQKFKEDFLSASDEATIKYNGRDIDLMSTFEQHNILTNNSKLQVCVN